MKKSGRIPHLLVRSSLLASCWVALAVVASLFISGGHATAIPHLPMPEHEPPLTEPGGTIWVPGSTVERATKPLKPELAAFERPQTSADILSPSAAQELRDLVASVAVTGTALDVDPSDSRRVLEDPATGLTVYAAPAGADRVCYVISEDVGSGCVDHLTHEGVSVSISQSGVAEPILVFGFFGRDVANVTAVGVTAVYPAVMGEGAYTIRVPHQAADEGEIGLKIVYRDGSQKHVPLLAHPNRLR